MPSFDIVSEVDMHELRNAVDQTAREIGNRFDFKGTRAAISQSDTSLTLEGDADFQLSQICDILYNKMSKRGLDINCLDKGKVEQAGVGVRQIITVREGIDKELAKKIVKTIKEAKLKVQAAIQGEQVRVTGKKRDDLQAAIALMRETQFDLPLQYINFRD